MKPFRSPEKWLKNIDAQLAAGLITTLSDVALIVNGDREGIIEDIALGSDEVSLEFEHVFIGRRFVDTVTVESRPKVEALLFEARAHGVSRWRRLIHLPTLQGADLPMLYTAAEASSTGRIIAVGRSLRFPRLPDVPTVRGEPQSVGQLTELVGRVPLKELVRDTTGMIERLCIEAALELTGDNRASAAEMLGLSRQSLYVKLRRYGLGERVAPGRRGQPKAAAHS